MSTKQKIKRWIHPADVLTHSAVNYVCKFLGSVAVEQPKGLDVVQEAIRKMKFNKQIKKAEGIKSPKVELNISINGVQIRNPKLRILSDVITLHRISFCADDKQDKRIFSFIAKCADSADHMCYVFDSNKKAEEITLTIGQAFHLAYRRFLARACSDEEEDMSKRIVLLQRRNQSLEEENVALHQRVLELETQLHGRASSDAVADTWQAESPAQVVSPPIPPRSSEVRSSSEFAAVGNLQTPPRAEVGRRLENLSFEDSFVAGNGDTPQHGISSNGGTGNSNYPFDVGSSNSGPDMMDMQAGFSRGLSMDQGNISFALDDFDPLSPARTSAS